MFGYGWIPRQRSKYDTGTDRKEIPVATAHRVVEGVPHTKGHLTEIAAETPDELRSCPPAPGFVQVEVPGEREASARAAYQGKPLRLPAATGRHVAQLAQAFGGTIENG